MVALTGVGKRYRGRGEVLADVDLEIPPGRPVGVVGGNGTGKSTLLRIVAGCCSASAGRVTGRPRVVGYLPQAVPPPPRLTVLAYLRHRAALYGVPAADRLTGATELLDDLGFTGDRIAALAALSSGNLQKVGLAQALGSGRADSRALLVLDEPWTALDDAAATALERRLAAWCAGGRALLVADHTGRAAALPAARMFRLVDGRLTAEPAARPAPAPEGAVAPADGWTTIVLSCPADPVRTLAALPPVTRSWTEDGLLGVCLPAGRGDALLAAALATGCSVVGVRRAR